MGTYRLFAQGGQRFDVDADSADEAASVLRQEMPDLASRGFVVRDEKTKAMNYTSPGYSTSDPEMVSEIMSKGYTPGQASRQSIYEQTIQDQPVIARAAGATRFVPFVGEYADELLPPAQRDAMRLGAEAYQQRRPVESLAAGLGTSLAGSLPLAAMALPERATSIGGAILRGGIVGGGLGATEGAVSGYGAGTDPLSRRQTAIQRAGTGAMFGTALGAGAPVAGAAIGAAAGAPTRVQQAMLGRRLGLSPEAATLAAGVRGFEQGGAPIPMPTVPRSLAETSDEMRGLLDLGMSVPSAGRAQAKDTIEAQANEAAADLNQALDDALGVPSGVKLQQEDIMRSSHQERSDLYDDAYRQAIDYDTPAGAEIESLASAVDTSILNDANKLMRRERVPTAQQIRIEQIDVDGVMQDVITELPNVQQLDYITRALFNRAKSGDAGPEDIKTLRSLAFGLRAEMDSLVPEYRAARSKAAEVIDARESLDTGYDVLKSDTTREDAVMAVRGMTDGELNNVRSGMRQYIDDTVAKTKSPLNMEDQDAKEAVKALGELTSRASQDKIRTILGVDEGNALIARIQNASDPLRMRATGQGAPTAPRQFAMDEASRLAQGQQGALERIATQQGTAQSEIARIAAMGGQDVPTGVREIVGEVAPFVATQRAPRTLAETRAALDRILAMSGRPEAMLQTGIRGGYQAGVAGTPAAGELARYLGLAPEDVRRIAPPPSMRLRPSGVIPRR